MGDSAYQAETFLLKPLGGNALTLQEIRFNKAITSSRVKIEQYFGQLKRVFHALHGELR